MIVENAGRILTSWASLCKQRFCTCSTDKTLRLPGARNSRTGGPLPSSPRGSTACPATAKGLCRPVPAASERCKQKTAHGLALFSSFSLLSVRATLRLSWVSTCPWARCSSATHLQLCDHPSHEVNGKPQLVVASASEVRRFSVLWQQNRKSTDACWRYVLERRGRWGSKLATAHAQACSGSAHHKPPPQPSCYGKGVVVSASDSLRMQGLAMTFWPLKDNEASISADRDLQRPALGPGFAK